MYLHFPATVCAIKTRATVRVLKTTGYKVHVNNELNSISIVKARMFPYLQDSQLYCYSYSVIWPLCTLFYA